MEKRFSSIRSKLNSNHTGNTGNFSLKGELLALASAICWAIYSVIILFIDSSKYSNLFLTRKMFFYSSLFMIPILLINGFSFNFSSFSNLSFTFNLLYLSIVSSAICYLFWNKAIAKLGNKTTMAYVYLLPLVSLITGNIVLHEKIIIEQIFGTFLIILGLFLSQKE